MSAWRLVLAGWQHVKMFGHWPDWQSFNGWLICERCLRPPSRGMRLLRPVIERGTMGL